MKLKSLRILLIATLLLTSLATIVRAESQLLADTDDIFEVTTPIPNAVVQGTIATVFKVYDDDQATVPYQISLMDAAKCSSQQALVARGNSTSTKSESNSLNWSTYGPTVDQTTIGDGAYCQLVCVSLKNGTQPYTACNGRIINVRNNNHIPVITSTIPSKLNITATEDWQYDVNATDADGNTLTYSLSDNPSFLSIDSSSGLISTNSNTRTAGAYKVTVSVSDAKGATATQTWTLVIGSGTGNNSTDEVTITAPLATSVFSGADNEITWTAQDGQGIDGFTLSYASFPALDTYTNIANVDNTQTSYTWDVSNITSGTYAIKIVMRDTAGNEVSDVSQEFEINGIDNGGNSSSPLIIDVSPVDKTTITELKPQITGKFSPAAGSTIDTSSFVLKLDDTDITANCAVDDAGFTCVPTADLAKGSHKVNSTVSDSNNQQTTLEWTFTIADTTATTVTTTSQTPSVTTIILVILGVIVLILLFVIPWILYVRWRKQQQEKIVETTTTTTVIPSSSAPIGTSVQAISVSPSSAPVAPSADPLSYPSYEDYLNAVAEGTANLISNTPAPAVDPSLPVEPAAAVELPNPIAAEVVTPAAPLATSALAEPSQAQQEPLQPASGLPDWLNPVDNGDQLTVGTNPLPAAQPAVVAPTPIIPTEPMPVEPTPEVSQPVVEPQPLPSAELATLSAAVEPPAATTETSTPIAPVANEQQPATAQDMLAEHSSLPPLPEDTTSTSKGDLSETGIAEKEQQ